MSALGKAKNFIELLKKHDWKGKLDKDEENDYAKITAWRGDERLEISWTANQLTFPPKYEFAGTHANLHSAAVARRHVMASGPDINAYLKRRRRKTRRPSVSVPRTHSKQDGQPEMKIPEKMQLPFDIETDSDNTILRAIRGSRLIWTNSMTGLPESAYVPPNSNRDLQNTFYLADNAKGRTFVSFMSDAGVFRAVYLDAILQIR